MFRWWKKITIFISVFTRKIFSLFDCFILFLLVIWFDLVCARSAFFWRRRRQSVVDPLIGASKSFILVARVFNMIMLFDDNAADDDDRLTMLLLSFLIFYC